MFNSTLNRSGLGWRSAKIREELHLRRWYSDIKFGCKEEALIRRTCGEKKFGTGTRDSIRRRTHRYFPESQGPTWSNGRLAKRFSTRSLGPLHVFDLPFATTRYDHVKIFRRPQDSNPSIAPLDRCGVELTTGTATILVIANTNVFLSP